MARTRATRLVVVLAVAVIGLVGTAGWAAAHVSVEPAEVAKGATVDLAFRSPNEGSTAIVAFEVEMPDGVTTFVPAAPPGWSVEVRGQLVRWTGGRVAVGATAAFPLRLGPLPSTGTARFPATQTYEDGTVVRWAEASGGGHPAPAVVLTGTAVATTTSTVGTGHGHETVETAGDTGPVVTKATEKTDSVTGVIGIVLAAMGVTSVLGWVVFVAARARGQVRADVEREGGSS